MPIDTLPCGCCLYDHPEFFNLCPEHAAELDEQEFLEAALEYRELEATWMEEALSA